MTREYREYAKTRIEYLLKISSFDERDKEALEMAIKALSQEPKSGKWIEHPEIETSMPEDLMFYECSECGDKQCYFKADTCRRRFCGVCGAKMESEEQTDAT